MNEACKREISVEIPADVVAKERDKLLKKYSKLARIPGFRAGKAPAKLIESHFGGDIRSELTEALLPRYFRAEVEKQNLTPVSQPYVNDLHMEEGQPIRFKATFEVMPEIKVSGYKGLKADRQEVKVTDEEVQEALRQLQERQASYEAVEDRELKDGDFGLVSFVGNAKGSKTIVEKKLEIEGSGEVALPEPEAKPIEIKDVLVEIGGVNTVKEFSEHLRGAKPGEEREFDVTYAEDFSDQRLAGQIVHYKASISGVKKKVMPELTDDFAKELGEFATLDELRNRIRENIEAERRHEIEHKEKEQLVDQLVAANEFPVPQALLDRQIDTRLERGLRALAAQGLRPEQMRKLNFDKLREGQKDSALREVRASLLLERIAELEKIEVSDDDLNKEIESAAASTGEPVAQLRQRLEKDGALDRIRERMRNERALDFVYQQSA